MKNISVNVRNMHITYCKCYSLFLHISTEKFIGKINKNISDFLVISNNFELRSLKFVTRKITVMKQKKYQRKKTDKTIFS